MSVLNSIGDFLGFGNPYQGAPSIAQPNQAAYQPNTGGVNQSIGSLQQFAQQPGVTVDTANQDQTRAQQQSLADMLLGSANGTAGPSAAQVQMRQGLDQALSQGRSMAQSVAQQTANPIAALQAAGGQQSLLQRQALGDSAQLRAQEQLNSRQQLEQALSSMRYGDISNQAQQVQTGLGNRQMNLSALNAVLGGQSDLMRAQQAGSMGYDQMRVQMQNQQRQAQIDSRAADMANRRAILSTVLQTASSLGSAAIMGGMGGGAASAAAGAATKGIIGGANNYGIPTGGLTTQDLGYANQMQNDGFVGSGGQAYMGSKLGGFSPAGER